MIKVFIVHPNPLVCESLAALFNKEADITVCCFATNVAEAIRQIQGCNVVLASTVLPRRGTLEFIKTITSLNPGVKVLIMGKVRSDEALLEYIEAGATGYYFKQEGADKLLEKIRAAYEGKAFVSPQLAAKLMDRVYRLFTLQSVLTPTPAHSLAVAARCWETNETLYLTPRERQVLELLRQGLSNREIAAELVLEVGTVKNHVHNIYRKLEISSRRELKRSPAPASSPGPLQPQSGLREASAGAG